MRREVSTSASQAANASAPVEALASYAAWKSNGFADHTIGADASSNTRRNQARSTSAMCRTRASSDSVDGFIDRSRSCSSLSPAHFMARVSRW